MTWLIIVALALTLVVMIAVATHIVTLLEYERGIRYRRGRQTGVLGPGRYWVLGNFIEIKRVDIRRRIVTVPAQEVLTHDAVSIKLSLLAHYEVAAPEIAVNAVVDYEAALYAELQAALREQVNSASIDEVLEQRDAIGARLLAQVAPRTELYGLRLHTVHVKDLIFPGPLRQVFAQVAAARQEGLALLEKARGESAALRHLANAARLLHGNPHLYQLRMLQLMSDSQGNTFVVNLSEKDGIGPEKNMNLVHTGESETGTHTEP